MELEGGRGGDDSEKRGDSKGADYRRVLEQRFIKGKLRCGFTSRSVCLFLVNGFWLIYFDYTKITSSGM